MNIDVVIESASIFFIKGTVAKRKMERMTPAMRPKTVTVFFIVLFFANMHVAGSACLILSGDFGEIPPIV
jgi:hypothetical protein